MVLIVFVAASFFVLSDAQSQMPPCHLIDVDVCLSHVIGFTDERAGPKSESVQHERQCTALGKADTCLRNYTRVCATPPQSQLFSMIFNGIRRINHEYCSRGSPLRAAYLTHVPCLRSVMRDPMNPCMRDFQLMGEQVTEAAWNNRINYACCAYHRVGGCMMREVGRACGDQTADFSRDLVKKLVSRLPEIRCRDLTERSPVCQQLPPFGTSPRGGKTTSVINKLIRTYTSSST